MSERQIFSNLFIEKYADNKAVAALVEEVETRLQELMEQHEVSSWQELPEEVLESFEVTINARARGSIQ